MIYKCVYKINTNTNKIQTQIHFFSKLLSMSPSVTKCKVDSTQGGERTQGLQEGMLISDFNTFCNFEPKTQGLQHGMLISGNSDFNTLFCNVKLKTYWLQSRHFQQKAVLGQLKITNMRISCNSRNKQTNATIKQTMQLKLP